MKVSPGARTRPVDVPAPPAGPRPGSGRGPSAADRLREPAGPAGSCSYREMPSRDISAPPTRRANCGATSTPMIATASQMPATMGNQAPSLVG